MAGFQQSFASQVQSFQSIKIAVRQFITAEFSAGEEYEIKLGNLDGRLKLPLCTKSLEVFLHGRSIKPGRNTLGVKCSDTKKWTIYTSARIKIFKKVIVLTQPIRRGEIFDSNLIKFENRDISTLRSGYLTDPLTIAKQQATRNLNSGAVINQSNFRKPKLVKRGEKVVIKVSSNNLNISMAGIALMDGIKGQNIKVKNIKSKQIVQATVINPRLVAVMF